MTWLSIGTNFGTEGYNTVTEAFVSLITTVSWYLLWLWLAPALPSSSIEFISSEGLGIAVFELSVSNSGLGLEDMLSDLSE